MVLRTIEHPKLFTFNSNILKNVLLNGTNALNGAALNDVFTVILKYISIQLAENNYFFMTTILLHKIMCLLFCMEAQKIVAQID